MVAHTSSSKGVNVEAEYVRMFSPRSLMSSISFLGRHRSREEGERRYCSIFTGSTLSGCAPRPERRGALFGSVDGARALRFLDVPVAGLVSLVVPLLGIASVKSAVFVEDGAFASALVFASRLFD